MTDTIQPHQLASALDHAPAGAWMPLLDRFDTLLWRNVQAPADVFDDFGEVGPTRQQRIWAETRAQPRPDRAWSQ